jgi:hypothetical protein
MKKWVAMFFLAVTTFLNVQSDTIPVKGDLPGGGPQKNPALTPPVEVYQDETGIELTFLCDLGKLNITVTDQINVEVYQQGVDAVEGSKLYIDTTEWSAGEYVLSITDGQGGYLEGSFEII